MGMVAIRLVPVEQISNQPLPGGCIWNLIKTGSAVSEEKSYENLNKTFYPCDPWPKVIQWPLPLVHVFTEMHEAPSFIS